MAVTNHARIRGRQRGISEAEMKLLTVFGRMQDRPDNMVQYILDRKGYLQLEEVLRKGVQILDKLKSQVVICDENHNIVTCYHK